MPINPDDHMGKVLKRTYRLVGFIDEGGMSQVYRGQDLNSHQSVAVKILLTRYSVNSDLYNKFLHRFNREVQIISRFQHPNIMPIYDYGNQDGLFYLVMPYITGGTLSRLLQNGPLPPYQALTYIEQAASALDYAHGQRVVHRDIKPSNFLLNTNRQLLLSDFGVAHVRGETFTQEGEFIGTPGYAPKEALFDGHIDGRADVYSLGVVLCEMLTGFIPSETPSTCPTLPSSVDIIIRKATAENPQSRYASAGELAVALRIAVENEHSALTQVSPPPDISSNQNPKPPIPPDPVKGGRKRLALILIPMLLLIALLVGAGTFAGLFSTKTAQTIHQSPVQTPTLSPEQQAQQTVLQYYSLWNKKNYQAAYNLLSHNYQLAHPYVELYRYYPHTYRSCLTINSTTENSNGFLVTITDMALEDNTSRPGKVVNVYKGDFTVSMEGGF